LAASASEFLFPGAPFGNLFFECIQNTASNEETCIVTMLDKIFETLSVMVNRRPPIVQGIPGIFPYKEM
jgi:hypothetical protein